MGTKVETGSSLVGEESGIGRCFSSQVAMCTFAHKPKIGDPLSIPKSFSSPNQFGKILRKPQ